jgi:hypothetical protein
MSESQVLESRARSAEPTLAQRSKDFGEMQQDLLAELFDDQLLNDCYQQLAEYHPRLTGT